MKIEAYRFGEIIVDGKVYDHDVILSGSEVRRWVRRESHNASWEEVEDLLELKPEVVIFGTGAMGVMRVPSEVIDKLRSQGVEVVIEQTERAVEIYNQLSREKKVVAALHLTC